MNPNHKPDITIEQIEAEIRDSQFQQSEAEAYLARRSRAQMLKQHIGNSKDGLVAWVYREGVKQGKRDAILLGIASGLMACGLFVFSIMAL